MTGHVIVVGNEQFTVHKTISTEHKVLKIPFPLLVHLLLSLPKQLSLNSDIFLVLFTPVTITRILHKIQLQICCATCLSYTSHFKILIELYC